MCKLIMYKLENNDLNENLSLKKYSFVEVPYLIHSAALSGFFIFSFVSLCSFSTLSTEANFP